MTRIAKLIFMAAMIGGMVGCVSPRSPNPPPMDIESATRQLMDKMLRSSRLAKKASGRSQIAVIGTIENITAERNQERLDIVGETIRVALLESELFEVKDDAAAEAIKSRIRRGADGGLEDPSELLGSLGRQEAPGFIILGNLRRYSDDGGYRTYRLLLAIYDLKTGKIVWEGIQTNVRL